MHYYQVKVLNWNGTDYTWHTYKIFQTKDAADKFNTENQGKLTKQGWETEGVETCLFEEFK